MKIVKLSIIFFLLIGFSCYQPIIKPTDFDSFWEKSVKSLGTEVKSEILKDSILGEKRITLNRIESFQGVSIYAWVSEPISKEKYPIYVKFSGFGRGQTDKKSLPYEWFLKQKNNINMVVDIRGQGLSTDQIDFKAYLTNGLEDKDNYIYRGAYLDAVKAIDFIAQNEKSDGNIIAIGGSQGGALSIVASALNKKVTMCLVGFPFLTDIYNYDKTKWPMKIWIHEAALKDIDLDDLHTSLSYFDVLNFADRIDVPVFLRTQEVDTITPKEGTIKLFESIKGNKKNLYVEPCEGHGCSSVSQLANELERIFIEKNLLKN